MIKMIASDLDGTLLQNGKTELEPEVCSLIQSLTDMGILFVAASGRQIPNLERLFAPVKEKIAYIAENGCLSQYKNKILHKDILPRELGQEIMHTIWNKDGAEILLSGERTCYIQPKNPAFYDHMVNVVKNDVTVVDDIFAVEEAYMKISVYEERGIAQSEDYWKEAFGTKLTVVTSGNAWLDMTPEGSNKGSALKRLQTQLGILPEECMAFGDHYNDVEMLQAVKYSYAMTNAQEGVKQICRFSAERVEPVLKKIIKKGGWE
jgi:Cof subfamily protein (haloacid dehalogenase superfamily)